MPVVKSTPPLTPSRNDPFTGSLLVVFSMATFTGLSACAKALTQAGMHGFEVLFFRNLFAVLVFSPLLYYRGWVLFDTAQLPTYAVRCLVALVSMLGWFYAISQIPIGEVTAITFITPLFGTLAAIFVLGEKVRARRWTALGVGFIGALIVLRPGASSLGMGHLAALISTLAGGFSAVLVKQLTARDDPNKIVFLTHVFLAPMSLIPVLFVWTTPTLAMVPLLLGLGVFATLGHATLVRGYSMMDASLGLTFEFAKLPFTAVVAYIFFNETIDRWTWLGAFIIIGSATYIAQREAQVRADKRAALALEASRIGAQATSAPATGAPATAVASPVALAAQSGIPSVARAIGVVSGLGRRLRGRPTPSASQDLAPEHSPDATNVIQLATAAKSKVTAAPVAAVRSPPRRKKRKTRRRR